MNNWETIRLGDAATFINGYAFKPKDWKTEGLEIIRIQNLTKSNGLSNYYDGELDPRYKVIKGDFLISWSATLGIFEWRGNDAWLNQHIFKVVFDKKEFDKSFFKHLIAMSLDAMGRETHGSTMKHITKPRFDNFQIPYPPLAEQKQIAAILDAADSLRQKDQQMVEHYTALSQSLFLEMFGDPVSNPMEWEKKILSDFIQNLNTGVSVNSGDEKYSQEKFGILKTSCVYSGEFRPEEAKVIRGDEFERMKLNPQADSIIISRMNTTELVGKSSYIDQDYPNLFLPDRLWQSEKSNLDHNVRWLAKAISFDSFMNEIGKISSGTSGSMKNISKKNFLNLPLIYPPADLQNQFAERIAVIEQQKQQAKTNLQKSEALFNSLLQRTFTGELTADRAA